MDNWIARLVALLCTLGSLGLLWVFGVFVVVPWRAGRMLALNASEIQVLGVSLVFGTATLWGALRIFRVADHGVRPRLFATIRLLLILAALGAIAAGSQWTLARLA